MGILGGLIKVGVAKRIFTEVRKPHNQERAKRLFQQVTNRGKAPVKPTGPGATPRP